MPMSAIWSKIGQMNVALPVSFHEVRTRYTAELR